MNEVKKKKGITLVALVITIVILLILAGISISTLTNTGIFQKAKDAKKASENAEKEQKQTLSEYERELNKYTAQELTDDKINTVLSEKENTILKDKFGNIFTLPAGFKVVVNDDTGNAKTVDKGIVIEDVTDTTTKGSQFVWVPVGNIKKDDGTTVEINLDRYTFDKNGISTPQGENIIETYCNEGKSKGNAIAKNITNFKNSVATNGGYYIGRYEARTIVERKSKDDKLAQLTEKKADPVYNYVTQFQAAEQAKNMYNGKNITSDLMNSYAWDTAIIFIQNCTEQKNYANQSSLNVASIPSLTGTANDIQCNIFDMASNVFEWTTETSSSKNDNVDTPCVRRGGYCNYRYDYTSIRYYHETSYSNAPIGFRPILYINV